MKYAIAVGLIALSAMSVQADEAWIPIVGSADGKTALHAKRGSGKLIGRQGSGFTIVERQKDLDPDRTTYTLVTVSLDDCLTGYGRMRYSTLGGSPLVETDFVLAGTTLADVSAAVYCAAAIHAQSQDL